MRFIQALMKGALAGFLATAPMTVVMKILQQRVPWWQDRTLPPHKITRKVLRTMGLKSVDQQHHQAATWTNHFAFGAAAGTLYPLIYRLLPWPPVVKSMVFGVGVWLASYLGWLPLVGLMESATRKSRSYNVMMVAAHLVWGAITGLVFRSWPRREKTVIEQAEPAYSR